MVGGGFPSPYKPHKVVGAQPGQSLRAIVVNVMDPEKIGRVQIRVVGHMDDLQAIPDEKLPWVKVRNGTMTPSLQTASASHGLIPGTMVTVEGSGEGGQDYLITGTIPNDRKDDNQSHPPAAYEDSKQCHTNEQYQDTTKAWRNSGKNVYQCTTTEQAWQQREDGRKARKTGDIVDESRNKSQTPDHYGKRQTSKDPDGGTIATTKANGSNAQDYIQQVIGNASSVVPNMLPAIQQLQQVRGNPRSVDSIGLQNYMQIISQLGSWFGANSSNKEDSQKYDCDSLLNTPDNELSSDMLEQKQICTLLHNYSNDEAQTS